MDICSYINSKPIREYLKDINYDFNSKEAAWLIWQCFSIPLEEKHKAWKQLIQEMPDFDLGERFSYLPGNSLYELIRRSIKHDEECLKIFEKKEAGAVYRYRFYCFGNHSWCEDYEGVYSSLEECWNEIEEDMDLNIEVVEIRKQYISTNSMIEVRYEPRNRTVLDIYSNYNDDVNENKIDDSFTEMWFNFPVPFEKGDILVPVHKTGPNYLWSEWGPFVMDSITPWEKELNERMKNEIWGDSSDMLAWGYFQDPDGRIYHEGTHDYMNLDYYKGPFNGPRRLLIALSNFVKGKIRLELLLTAYRKIIIDEFCDDVMLRSWYCEEELTASISIIPSVVKNCDGFSQFARYFIASSLSRSLYSSR